MLVKTSGPRSIQVIGEFRDKAGKVTQVYSSRQARQHFHDMWLRTGGDLDAVNTKVYTFTQDAEPTDANHPNKKRVTGDLWVDTNDNNRLYRWSGTAWVSQRDATIAIAQTSANTAQTDLEANNVSVESLSQLEWSDSSGTWPSDSSTDHVLSFKRDGTEIATHTIRVVFTQSTGDFTVTSQAETLEATVETITGSGGRDAKGVVSHTASGIIGKVTAQAVNQASSGGSPSK